ncbi:LysR family transcriptional regulator [Streptomyces coffeae]|uniref:LysR family transcriptional regulator n=1 Tax=Streptomyces coffeae TaxID=621382 RepID=A0ABS1NER2_9ACTN|nr:LysR family transcriptional regulator [Streptomyces coffeae]MBL1098533.1 LysR family transcriptional regulator [Streptomyces coffeae]
MFGLDRLRVLAAVAAHGSIASAARELHITPSALSQQLNKLERETGHQLLEPHGRSVRFTHAGRVLAAHANQIVQCAAAAESDLLDLRTEVIGPLRIGAVGSAIRALLTTALTTLARDHPRVTPTVRDGEVVDMLPDLLAGDLDLVVVDSWQSRPLQLPEGLAMETLASEAVDIALSTRHPLAEYGCVELNQLDGMAWTSCPSGTEPYESLVQLLRSHGLEPDIRYTVAEYATQLKLVEANLAAALIPAMVQPDAPAGVRFVQCGSTVRREIKVAWRARAAGPLVRACLESLKDATRPCDQGAPP